MCTKGAAFMASLLALMVADTSQHIPPPFGRVAAASRGSGGPGQARIPAGGCGLGFVGGPTAALGVPGGGCMRAGPGGLDRPWVLGRPIGGGGGAARVSPGAGRRGGRRARGGAGGVVCRGVRQEILDAAALEILTVVLRDNKPAEPLLKKTLQKLGTKVTNPQRAKLGRRVLGVTALRSRLAYIVDYVDSVEMDKEFPGDDPITKARHLWQVCSDMLAKDASVHAKDLLAAYLLHEEEKDPTKKPRTITFLSEKRLQQLKSVDPEKVLWKEFRAEDNLVRIAASCSLPFWLVDLWADQLCNPSRSHGGLPLSEVRKLAETTNIVAPVTLRVNRLKLGGRTALVQALLQEDIEAEFCQISPWGVRLKNGRPDGGIWSLGAWKAGLFEVQDEGSQLIALSTEAVPGEEVLDYCAGNGGKTLALAAMVQNQGQVYAHDVDEGRLRQIEGSVGRAGCTCVQTTTPAELASDAHLWYNETTGKGGVDVVLVDAPCSSTGVLRRNPSLRWSLQPEDVELLPRLQQDILRNASRHVRPGGGLVYATCAINRLENEDVADWFSQNFKGTFQTWPFENFGSNRRALLPHIHGTDGFYISRWRRIKFDPEGGPAPMAAIKRLQTARSVTLQRAERRQEELSREVMSKINEDIEQLQGELNLIQGGGDTFSSSEWSSSRESSVEESGQGEGGLDVEDIIDVRVRLTEPYDAPQSPYLPPYRFPDSPYSGKKKDWDS